MALVLPVQSEPGCLCPELCTAASLSPFSQREAHLTSLGKTYMDFKQVEDFVIYVYTTS